MRREPKIEPITDPSVAGDQVVPVEVDPAEPIEQAAGFGGFGQSGVDVQAALAEDRGAV